MKTNRVLSASRRALGLSMLLLLGACSTPSSRVILLEEADGKVGKIAVAREGKTVELDQANQAADFGQSGLSVTQLSGDEVASRYGSVRATLPKAPLRFVLFFETGGNALTEESKLRIGELRSALAGFAAPDILVTGHSDRVGALEINDTLSVKRAEVVRDLLVAEGFDVKSIEVAGRGEREPAVATDDEVDEPRNRRVEVKLR